MVEHFIHYNGKDYTPLEFSEMIANELPDTVRTYLHQLAEGLKRKIELIKLSDEIIANAKRDAERDVKNRELHERILQGQLEGRELTVNWFNRDLQHFYLVLSLVPLTDELAKIVRKEVEDLK